MSWTWRYETRDGKPIESAGASPSFPTQSDAETWIGESWPELLDAGVDAVTLLEDASVIYGPMSLHPAS
jgi:hypothetical protein